MKITTRIITGYGLFIVLLVGMVIYQILTINGMQSINRTLSEISFQTAHACLEALRDRDLVEEYTRKTLVTLADPDYLKKLQESQVTFDTRLSEIKTYAKSDEELAEVKRLTQVWDAYMAEQKQLLQNLPKSGGALPDSMQDTLDKLRAQTLSVYQTALRSISSKVDKSRKTGETASLVLYCATLVALAISILISFLIFLSISKPLAHLTEGTRAIAEGKFFYRLDTSRNDEFSQLAKDFNTMTHRLNELDELKKDFVSHASHELKTPLASMQETIQLMLDLIPGPLTDKQKRLLELNLQSGKRLTSMIGNLLDLSKMEAGVLEYELKRRDLIPLVRNAVEELDVQTQEKQMQIQTAFPNDTLPVECDGDRIVQVIVNLVGNAVKFSPKAATVRVDVEAVREIPEKMPERWRRIISMDPEGYFGLVTVTDSGPGIPDLDKEKVFEKFQQVKQGKKMPGQGVGLGLAICRTIIQAHRGAIWVEDNPGGGSRFRLLLRSGSGREEAVSRASSPI
jgi:signal transduction histidine kinase